MPNAVSSAGHWARSLGWGAVNLTFRGNRMTGTWQGGKQGHRFSGTLEDGGLVLRVKYTKTGWTTDLKNTEYVFTFDPKTKRINYKRVRGIDSGWIKRN